jgi:drug/metabolite transporter (DMT)-like permease
MEGTLTRERQDARGITLMVVASALITLNDAIAKWLTATYPVGQILCLRGVFFMVPVMFLVWRGGGLKSLRVHSVGGQVVRAGLFVLASAFFVTSVGLMPLSTVIALTFASPLIITALAPSMLGERVGWRRWTAVLVGFSGVLLIVRPFQEGWQLVALLPIAGAAAGSLRDIATRRITAHESSASILFYAALTVIVLGLGTSPFGWMPLSAFDLTLLAIQGFAMGVAHYMMVESFRLSEAALVAPFKYSGFLWALIYGATIWGEYPDGMTLAGAAVILASGLYILHRELRHKAATPSRSA